MDNNREPRVRLFAALRLPDPALAALTTIQRRIGDIPGVRWTSNERLHITAHFIGGVPEGRLPRIQAALATVADTTPRFQLEPDRICLVPPRQPRMIWAKYRKHDAFAALAKALTETLGGEPAREPLPHVTLARLKHAPRPRLPTDLPPFPPVEVDGVELWKSHLTQRGADYITLDRFPLGAES